jgi:hypothetical protein
MKLPHWSIGLLLASTVIVVLVAAGQWWIMWPTRTGRKFSELIGEGRESEALRMVSPRIADSLTFLLDLSAQPTVGERFTGDLHVTIASARVIEARSWTDLLMGRQISKGNDQAISIKVRRGSIEDIQFLDSTDYVSITEYAGLWRWILSLDGDLNRRNASPRVSSHQPQGVQRRAVTAAGGE